MNRYFKEHIKAFWNYRLRQVRVVLVEQKILSPWNKHDTDYVRCWRGDKEAFYFLCTIILISLRQSHLKMPHSEIDINIYIIYYVKNV